MKIAVCFYGHLGGKSYKDSEGGVIPVSETYECFKEIIIKANPDCKFDFFVHSWSFLDEKDILHIINPIKYKIEPQVNFWKEALSDTKFFFDIKDTRLNISLFLRRLFHKSSYNFFLKEKIINKFRVYSRWYSTKKVIEIKRLHEVNNNFKYDFVFLTRFDIFWYNAIQFKNLKKNYFYSSAWNVSTFFGLAQKNFDNKHFQDYWFISNSQMIDMFATLYDFLTNYPIESHRASFQHAKKIFGQENLRYILTLVKDYELYRRVIKNKK